MAYAYSRARKIYMAAVSELLLSSREADTKACSSTRARKLAHASAVIITSTKIESYLEDLILDWGAAIGTAGFTASALPKETRVFLLNGSVVQSAYRKLLLLEHGERDFLRLVSAQIGANGEYRFAIDTMSITAAHFRPIIQGTKYPSEANLKKIFARCGLSDIFAALNRVSRRDVLPLHKSFSDLRTEIAHEGLPVGINGRDVRNRIREISTVVGYMDRAFYKHSHKLLGSTVWTT